ncbi:bifunctional phosphoribosylaminoimidazolecarboxamide formyltransferase/IMP cyclohydrolase [Parenemella sanctibonifatiensis]|uniref:Bifunctional purine biosynthesis protein PurH n=1 Tax=Parenemella sanctibonifatiensis TaxID=2016505 RepID=A0A255E8M4_9ACTN|nr:bifunctional phosphoribosylaminoimidazolecarboxamide formyltransferase/IMP cyclohydrolase [Parenemella sanctibonifatiensis]OYN87918.1 bifunctional phosphoribosylaminoimidazolecarboxamide formyltransferase/IMP cyclohydrolase [Parenemella sanctibonifatiensis]
MSQQPETPQERRPLRRALVSVYDKEGLIEVASELSRAGVEIVSTGSTAKRLQDAGVPVRPVEEVTGFPEMLDGRVKTLHPRIHAGILADLRQHSHGEQLEQHDIGAFDLVISNLYPFAETVAAGRDQEQCIEQIDIGGPAMVRAAAKNHANVAIITSPDQYERIPMAVAAGGFTHQERRELAAQAFRHTAAYDVQVATWLGGLDEDETDFSPWTGRTWEKVSDLRYGENSHQGAAIYRDTAGGAGLPTAKQLWGKEMSYNNYVDADAARRAAEDFEEPAVAIIKHANPCGIAVGVDVAEAHRLAHACDPVSAFGGVIAANRPVSVEMAEAVAKIFTEVIVAPGYEEGAVEVLKGRKNLRILECDNRAVGGRELRLIEGGMLAMDADAIDAEGDDPGNWELVSGDPADEQTKADLIFAWRACRAVKSNAILLASEGAAVGVGMGQVNRVDSCRLAVERAGDRAAGSVAASDAFFPFADGLEVLVAGGVRAVVQPGGSTRDGEVIQAAQKAGITMYLTGTRHFFH